MKTNPISRTELACCYGVSRKTFYNWLKNNEIKISNGYLKEGQEAQRLGCIRFLPGSFSKKESEVW